MYVLITCKFKKYHINSKQEKVEIQFFRHSRAANSVITIQIWPKFKLIQALMHVLTTYKYQKQPRKSGYTIFHYKSMGLSFRRSRADNSIVSVPIWPKFKLLLDIMHVIDTYKFKTDWINSNQEKVATSIF